MADKKVNNEVKRINLIDPNDFANQYAGNSFSDNKFNVSVPEEDLSILVELSTYAKGRSILVTSTDSNSTTTVTNKKINIKFNNNEIINLMTFTNDATTGNKPELTTKYTDLSTQLDTIDEALGLTSIDIDFNSSYTPMVNINFIDVRGGAIFQQGGSSKYSVFFRLPYPLFQLKIKGFYGKPVIYCLHLTKFTSRFNSQTGNFEITTNFVGYTYALLADMIIGYLKAAGETPRGRVLLAERNVLPINTLLQKISQIDDSIKKQLNVGNSDATTLSLYQQGESTITNLIDTVVKYSGNLQQIYSAKNFLASQTTNVDVVVVDINAGTGVRDELYNNVNNFFANFQLMVKAYNAITTNTNLNLIHNLGPVFTEINPNDLVQPISSSVKTGLQNAYSRYTISDDNQINTLVKRLSDSIQSKNNNLLAFVDFTDCLAVLNAQLDNITTQEKNVEIELGKQLYRQIKSILGFDPNIRNITNIFTTHIEVLLQLIFETSQKATDPNRVAQLSKFKGTNSLDISQADFDNTIFPWPEYQEGGQETYLGKPKVLSNPEQVPELQLVNALYDGMITSEQIAQSLSTVVTPTIMAWNSLNPIDAYKYQTTQPYNRLPVSTGPDDLATYIVMRATAFLGFSNTYLTTDEIKAFATAESAAVTAKFSSNFNVINGLATNYKTPADYLNAASTLGNPASSFTKRPFVLRQASNGSYVYTYIIENTDNRFILPTDMNFFGSGAIYNLSKTTPEPSKYLLSSRYCDTSDLNGIKDYAYYVDIIEKSDYENTVITPADNYTSNAFNVQNLFGAPTGDVSNWLKSSGFNTAFGKYGVQDFTQADYSGAADKTGLSDTKPFYSLFYDNAFTNTPNITGGRIKTYLTDWDLYNTTDGSVNNFKIFSNKASFLAQINLLSGNGNTFPNSKALLSNQINQGQNLLAFNNATVTFPFFGYSVNIEGLSFFQSLFGSRFYNYQEVHSKAYLFLHSFPWRGLVENSLNIGANSINLGLFNNPLIQNIFQYRTGFVQVPKLLPAFIGSLIWRYEKGGIKKDGSKFVSQLIFADAASNKIGTDPLKFVNINNDTLIFPGSANQRYPKTYQYCNWPNGSTNELQYSMKFGDIVLYSNIEDIILNLPSPAKQVFLNEFINFVNGIGDFANQGYTTIQNQFEVHPVSGSGDAAWVTAFNQIVSTEFNGTNNAANILTHISPSTQGTFFHDNYNVFSYISDFPNNYIIEYKQSGALDTTLKALFLDYKYLANCSWRLWGPTFNTVTSPCDASVYVATNDFNTYINAFVAGITVTQNTNNTQVFNNKNSLEIRHEIYRTLKKIYDKWIANTDSGSRAIFQCCSIGSIFDKPSRLTGDAAISKIVPGSNPDSLINSFRFINRAFVDIGDDLPINPIAISKLLIEGTDNSFYDLFSRILTDNNLIFVPLPTYIDYSDPTAVESIFQAYPYYQAKDIPTSGPSFVCMYVGQTSTKLDFQNTSEYPNDGMNLNEPSTVGDDMKADLKDFETPTAAFIVRYGQQNQNIFKDIVLDQAEFTETAESLRITDAIANSFSQTNQSYVGQNLYNVYSVRSYKAEVTMMGNAMIQPMMYFQLDNIPMFRGAYLIIGVKHHLQPNTMSTVFTGVRIKKVATPLIDIPTLYTSVLQGYQLPTGGTTTIASTYTNYVFKYHDLLRQNLPLNKNIQRDPALQNFSTTQIANNSATQLQNWGGGTLSENSAQGTKFIINYSYKQGVYDFRQVVHSPSDPWSAVFVSYIMTFGDTTFPAAASHYDYATKGLDGLYGYEVFPLNSGLTIKAEVGDIMVLPRKGNYTASHGNIIYKIENNTAFLIGGNRGIIPETTAQNAVNYSTKVDNNDGTVKASQLTLTNGNIVDSTNVGLYLLIMKKTQQKYYAGKVFSTTGSNPTPNPNPVKNSKPTSQQIQTNQVEVKNLLKAYFLSRYSDALSRVYTAAVMGNIQHESGFNPTVLVPDSHGSTSYGLLQWNSKTYPNAVNDAGSTVNSEINYLFTNTKFNNFLRQLNNLTQAQNNAAYVAFIFAKYYEGCQHCNDYNVYLTDTDYNQKDRSTQATKFYNEFNLPNDLLNW